MKGARAAWRSVRRHKKDNNGKSTTNERKAARRHTLCELPLGLERASAVAHRRLHCKQLRILHDKQLLFPLKRTQNLRIAIALGLEIKAKRSHMKGLSVQSFKLARVAGGLYTACQGFYTDNVVPMFSIDAAKMKALT
jgi:hypothetical protein